MTKTKTVAAPTADPGPERELATWLADEPPAPVAPSEPPAEWPNHGQTVVVTVDNDRDARGNVTQFKLSLTAKMQVESLKAANAVIDELHRAACERTVTALEQFVPSLAHDDEFKDLQKQRALYEFSLGQLADLQGRATALPEQIAAMLGQGNDPSVLENELAEVRQRLDVLTSRLAVVKANLGRAIGRWDLDVRAMLRQQYDRFATAADREFSTSASAVANDVLALFKVVQMAHATLSGADALRRVPDLAVLMQARGIAIPSVEAVAPANPPASKLVMVYP